MIDYKLFYLDKWYKFIEEYTMDGLKYDNKGVLPLHRSFGDGYKITTVDIEKLAKDLVKYSNIKQYLEENLGFVLDDIQLLEVVMKLIFDSCVGVFFTHAD